MRESPETPQPEWVSHVSLKGFSFQASSVSVLIKAALSGLGYGVTLEYRNKTTRIRLDYCSFPVSFGNIVLDQTKQDLQKQTPPPLTLISAQRASSHLCVLELSTEPLLKPALTGYTFMCWTSRQWLESGFMMATGKPALWSQSSTPSATPLSSPTRFQHVGPVVRPVRFWDIFCSLVVCSFFLLHALIHLLPIYNSQFEAQKVTIIIHKFLSSLNVFLGHCWCHLAIKMPKDD